MPSTILSREESALELLEFMRLEPNAKVTALSKGMRARLRLITALARRAPLILLDEPFSGIDPASRERIAVSYTHLKAVANRRGRRMRRLLH